MPPPPFDPCKQWLGIDAVDLVDPRRVLGLPPGAIDPQAVLQAAESRLARLRSVEPGPFAVAQKALLERVEEAREALLRQLASLPRSSPPTPASFTMPPPPGGAAPRPSAPVPVVPRVPVVPPPPAATASWPDEGDAARTPSPGIEIRPTVVYRKQSSGSGALLVLILALAAAAGALYWYKFRPESRAPKRSGEVARAQPPAVKSPSEPAPRPVPKAREERFGVPDRAVSSDRPPPDPRPAPPAVRRPPPDPEPPQPPPPATPPAPAPAPRPAAPAEDERRTDDLFRPVAAALRASDFSAAAAAAKEALAAATTDRAKSRAEQWAELVTFAEGFAGYRAKAVDAVKAGDEYDIDGKKVGVVEIDDKKFVFRYAGRNKTVSRDKIPGGILMAIVTGWFDEKPANDLYIGAYHVTKAEPDLTQARAAWERAEARGANAALLLPLLDDPVLREAAAEERPPSDDQ